MKRTVALLMIVTASWLTLTVAGHAAPQRNAHIVGGIRLCGGPAPGRCFFQGGVVLLYRGSHLLATQHTNRQAQFSFTVSPGRYTLEARTGGVARKQTFLAHAHRTTHANILIPIP
jgi:hypothetical protein